MRKKYIKVRIEDIKERGKVYGFSFLEVGLSGRNELRYDLYVISLFIEEVEVVGIEFYRDRLIDWFVDGVFK